MFKPISRGELGGSLTKHFSGVLYTLICPKHICADHAPTTPTQFIFFALHRSLYFLSFHPFLTLRSILTTPFLPSFALPLSPLLLSLSLSPLLHPISAASTPPLNPLPLPLSAHVCSPYQPDFAPPISLLLLLSAHFCPLSLPTFAPPISPFLFALSAYFRSSLQPTFASSLSRVHSPWRCLTQVGPQHR